VNLSAYSLKTGIFATLVFVLVLAMLLLDIVMVKMAEQDMITAEKKRGILLLRSVQQTLHLPFFEPSHRYSKKQTSLPSS